MALMKAQDLNCGVDCLTVAKIGRKTMSGKCKGENFVEKKMLAKYNLFSYLVDFFVFIK